jgi:thiamine pyrophosphokinase
LFWEECVQATIIAGGRFPPGEAWRSLVGEDTLVIGADGGAAQALARGLVPDIVVGDMDSLTAAARADLEARGSRFLVHPRAKDETDLELALTCAVAEGAEQIAILGALGGRLDHTLANLLLLALPQLAACSVRIFDGPEEALLLRGGGRACLHGRPGDLVSLLPLGGDARGVSTAGLAWPLDGESLRFGFSRGVSNEMLAAEAIVALEEGCLLVVHRSAVPASPTLGERASLPCKG